MLILSNNAKLIRHNTINLKVQSCRLRKENLKSGGSRTVATSKMELFVMELFTKSSIR